MLFLTGSQECNETNEEERGYTDYADQKKHVNQPGCLFGVCQGEGLLLRYLTVAWARVCARR